MVTLFQHISTLFGRILLSSVFLTSGVHYLLNWSERIAYLQSKGVPLPHVLLVLAVICWLVGGLSVLVGLKARLGAALLILCLVPATMMLHNFWAVESGIRGNEIEHFAKNLGLAGGLLLVIAFGAGGFSIDLFLRMRRGARLQK